jgi:hypothetical protein
MFDSVEHASLLSQILNNGSKKFYMIGRRVALAVEVSGTTIFVKIITNVSTMDGRQREWWWKFNKIFDDCKLRSADCIRNTSISV